MDEEQTPTQPVPAGAKPVDPKAEKPTMITYTDANGHSVKLHTDSTVSTNYDADPVSLEIFATLMHQYGLLGQVQHFTAETLKQDTLGTIRAVTACGEQNIQIAEVLKARLKQAVILFQEDVKKRSGN
jgi:hypothetical protein